MKEQDVLVYAKIIDRLTKENERMRDCLLYFAGFEGCGKGPNDSELYTTLTIHSDKIKEAAQIIRGRID
jgi:hypothetical protein